MKTTAFIDILLRHITAHPSMQPQDIVKLCFQATFGAEHLLTDIKSCEQRFFEEFAATPADTRDLLEILSDDFCRINISAWKHLQLDAQWLFRLFLLTAKQQRTATDDQFIQLLNTVDTLSEDDALPFSKEKWTEFRSAYEQNGIRPVRHSQEYRNGEQPAYRVMHLKYEKLIPVLWSLNKLRSHGNPVVISVDGRQQSDTTEIADILSSVLEGDSEYVILTGNHARCAAAAEQVNLRIYCTHSTSNENPVTNADITINC